jgi:ABC-type multidrug transport system ATPase subunit
VSETVEDRPTLGVMLVIRLEGREVSIRQAATLGRDQPGDLSTSNPLVSRQHLELRPTPEGWIVEDASSRNGTFYDGRRVSRLLVDHELELRLGNPQSGLAVVLEPVREDSAPRLAQTVIATGAMQNPVRVKSGNRTFTLTGTDAMSLGRDAGCSFVLEDPQVSRRHAELQWKDGWQLVDLGSANGSFHNGQRIQRLQIDRRAEIRLGHPTRGVLLEFEPLAVAAPSVEREGPTRAMGGGGDSADLDLGPLTCSHDASHTLRLGRGADNDVVLNDLSVSRHHAELVKLTDGGWELTDLQSHNGSFLNGHRIDRARVEEFDLIGIGHQTFRLVEDHLEEYSQAAEVGLEVLDLQVQVKDQVLVDGLTFSVPKKALLAAVGPSGAGKSTLLAALLGLRRLNRGQVLFGGRDLHICWDEFRQRIGYVPQEDVLHPQLTVRRALGFAAELRFPPDVSRADRWRRVDEVMADLRLTERAKLRIEKLSGGQRKRVSIALELLTRPTILFLDEPTSGLDPGLEKELMKLFKELAKSGRTVVVITHALQSLDLCDRALVLAKGGQMAYFGPPRDALTFFGQQDFSDVFLDLIAERDAAGKPVEKAFFKQRFLSSSQYETYVRKPLGQREARPGSARPSVDLPPARHGGWRQYLTLTRRYLVVIASDRVNSLLLLLQAPILAAIILLAISPGGFDLNGSKSISAGLQAILFLVISATYLGAGNSIREIVKELPIYARERMIGLSVSAYVASKVSVLAVITAFQAAVLVWIGTWRLGGPSAGAALPDLRLELWVGLVATGLAAMGLGLLISSLVTRADKAVTLLPLLLVPQLVLTFPQLRVEERPVLNQLSYVASAQWGHSDAASTIHLNQLIYNRAVALNPGLSGLDPDHASAQLVDQVQRLTDLRMRIRWRHLPGIWAVDNGVLLAMFVFEVLLAGIALRKRDPQMLTAGKGKRRRKAALDARLAWESKPL